MKELTEEEQQFLEFVQGEYAPDVAAIFEKKLRADLGQTPRECILQSAISESEKGEGFLLYQPMGNPRPLAMDFDPEQMRRGRLS